LSNIILNSFVGDAAFTGFDETEPLRKIFEWKTDVVVFDSRKEQRNQILSRPIRHWFINWEILDQGARDKLIELFQRSKGRYDTFLYTDREDYLASAVTIPTDGTEATYQLIQEYYDGETEAWQENRKDIVAGGTYAPVVTHSVDGAQTEVAAAPAANKFTLDDTTGIMTWSGGNEPSSGVLTCTFQFYFRVRFAIDSYEDLQIACTPIWRANELHLIEVI